MGYFTFFPSFINYKKSSKQRRRMNMSVVMITTGDQTKNDSPEKFTLVFESNI